VYSVPWWMSLLHLAFIWEVTLSNLDVGCPDLCTNFGHLHTWNKQCPNMCTNLYLTGVLSVRPSGRCLCRFSPSVIVNNTKLRLINGNCNIETESRTRIKWKVMCWFFSVFIYVYCCFCSSWSRNIHITNGKEWRCTFDRIHAELRYYWKIK
jgi:hypothetical protein